MVHTALWWGNMKEEDNLEDLSADGRVILKGGFKKQNVGLFWL
jgi:hypothetical protein